MRFCTPDLLWWVLMPIIFFGRSALSDEEGGFSCQKLSEEDISLVVEKVVKSLQPIVIKAVHDQNIHLSYTIKRNTEDVTKRLASLEEKVTSVSSDIESIKSDLIDARCGKNSDFPKTSDPLIVEVPVPSNCAEIKDLGNTTSGVYFISLPDGKKIQVYCDMTTDGGGWTVLQRRADITPHVDFKRGWSDYKNGFGDLEGEFWLGLDIIHFLTSQDSTPVRLRIDLESFQHEVAYAEYDTFVVSDEGDLYRLSVGGYTGRGGAGEALLHGNGYGFSTFDRDSDGLADRNLADELGHWWHGKFSHSSLNGPYLKEEVNKDIAFFWWTWKDYFGALRISEMKIKPLH